MIAYRALMGQAAAQKRWIPDEQLIPAVLAGNTRRMADLEFPDRCWLVAGLTLFGLTAEEIADRLDCCLRQVRLIRAEDMTMVCTLMQKDANNFADELRLATGELKAKDQEFDELRAELERVKAARDRLIDEKIVGVRLCESGHAMDKYNSYLNEKTGNVYCRTCHRENQQQYRDQSKVIPSGISPKLVLAGLSTPRS